MTQSARAAALRSTALVGLSSGLALAWPAWHRRCRPMPRRRAIDGAKPTGRCRSRNGRSPRPSRKLALPRPRADRAQGDAPKEPPPEQQVARPRPRPRAAIAPATRGHATLPPPPHAQADDPGRGAADLVDPAGRRRCGGKRRRADPQASARRCDAGGSGDIGSGGEEARRMDHPSQRRQQCLRRALSRLHRGQSELALADLPAPAPRSRAVGRPSRRRHRVVVVPKRIAALGEGQIRAGAGADRARRAGQCRAAGARRLAQ